MSLQESRIVNGARRTTAALRNADQRAGEIASSSVSVFGGAAKLALAALVVIPGAAYTLKIMDEPAKEVVSDVKGALPNFRKSVNLQSPIGIDSDATPATTQPEDSAWECTDGIRDEGTINTYLGRMVVAEYGLGDHNDSAVYAQAIGLLQTPAFATLNPHIANIDEPPMGGPVVFPDCVIG